MLKINFKIAEICPTMAIDSIIATATKMYPNIFLVAISGFILRLRITMIVCAVRVAHVGREIAQHYLLAVRAFLVHVVF